MKSFLFLVLLTVCIQGKLVNSYIDEEGRSIDHHIGLDYIQDSEGHLFQVDYNAHILGDNHIVNIDEVPGVKNVHCDISNIDMIIDFTQKEYSYNFYYLLNRQGMDKFVTAHKWNCSDAQSKSTQTMRKVLDITLDGLSVTLKTTQGHYEEAIKEGEIKMTSISNTSALSKKFCMGVNTDDCDQAAGPISIYTNKFINVQCSNCFFGAKATVFMSVKISWFKLKYIGAGFKDIAVNGGFVLDMNAQGGWSAGVDKALKIVDQKTIIAFSIGPIPITIWYEIPLHLLANTMIEAKAHATAGAIANWHIGDAYVSWERGHGWKMGKPNPKFTFNKVLTGDASFKGAASIKLAPSFVMHINRIIEAGITIDPSLMAEVAGDTHSKELCLDLSYEVLAEIYAALHINIPFVHLRLQKTFGPYKVVDTGVKKIGHWCAKVGEEIDE